MSFKVKQGDIFGRIGQNIGQGLAESIPREAQNQRLSSGLENIKPGTSPVDQYSSLIRSGASADQIAQILPLLERSNANVEAQRQANNPSQINQPTAVQGAGQANNQQVNPNAPRVEGTYIQGLNKKISQMSG